MCTENIHTVNHMITLFVVEKLNDRIDREMRDGVKSSARVKEEVKGGWGEKTRSSEGRDVEWGADEVESVVSIETTDEHRGQSAFGCEHYRN